MWKKPKVLVNYNATRLTIMYKIFILAFFLIPQVNLNAQVFTITYFNAYESGIEAFENNQLNGYAVIAEQAIKNDELIGWYFFKKVNDSAVDSAEYLSIDIYESSEKLFQNSDWWSVTEEESNLLNINWEEINEGELRAIKQETYQTYASLNRIADIKYTQFNFVNPSDSYAFLKEGEELFKPFFEKNMGERGLVGWGEASKLYSSYSDSTTLADQPTVMTVDHFSNYRVAEMHQSGELWETYDGTEEVWESTFFDFYVKNGWVSNDLYELIGFVEAEN